MQDIKEPINFLGANKMKDISEIDKRVYHLAKDYLPSLNLDGITISLIEKYLNPLTRKPRPTSKQGIYQRILESGQNANMKAELSVEP